MQTAVLTLTLGALVLLLIGCAGSPPRPAVDPAMSPDQVVRALSNRKLTSRGLSNDGFGLAAFKPFLRPLESRCRMDEGQLVPMSITEVNFKFRDANNVYHQARVATAPSGRITS